MSIEQHDPSARAEHATLVFERDLPVTVDKVFEAFANAKVRAAWSAPSETAVVLYDVENFIEGGKDHFRCDSKDDPIFHGTTHYLEIVPRSLIVSSETIDSAGKRLCASLTTLELRTHGQVTRLKSTTQVVSFVGADMMKGHSDGYNASLNNLVRYFA